MYNNALASFSAQTNVCSIQIMEKIGLKRDVNGDFAYPKLATDHPLSRHVLYRLTADEYFNRENK